MEAKTIEEREIKLCVPDLDTYQRIVTVLGSPSREINQQNFYFDRVDFMLALQEKVMIRVRLTGDGAELCLKDRAVLGDVSLSVRERTIELTSSEWQALSSGEIALAELPYSLCDEIRRSYGPLVCVGETTNLRIVFDLGDDYWLELDRTTFPGDRVDYEIEMELRCEHHTFETAIEVLKGSIGTELVASLKPSTPKYQRFVQALTSLA